MLVLSVDNPSFVMLSSEERESLLTLIGLHLEKVKELRDMLNSHAGTESFNYDLWFYDMSLRRDNCFLKNMATYHASNERMKKWFRKQYWGLMFELEGDDCNIIVKTLDDHKAHIQNIGDALAKMEIAILAYLENK